jgi:hypothetical protein
MGAHQAGDRGTSGAAVGQGELTLRAASALREAWDRLLDLVIGIWLRVLDRVAPLPETDVDHAIREEGERLRKAFPWLDERRR